MASLPEVTIELHPADGCTSIEVDFYDYTRMVFELTAKRAECVALKAEVERLTLAATTSRKQAWRGMLRLSRWIGGDDDL